MAGAPERAQRTASVTSASVRPSSASLARTASPRWMRTGVSTICPSRTSTSKYSAAATASTALLGSVSWFLDVSLASIGNPSSKDSLL
jgi:hypothetical protein